VAVSADIEHSSEHNSALRHFPAGSSLKELRQGVLGEMAMLRHLAIHQYNY